MPIAHAGEIAALAAAVGWTVSALAFEDASRRVGALAANLFKICFGLAYLTVAAWFLRGMALPLDADGHVWLWLSVSGLVKYLIGDTCLFRAMIIMGARVTLLVSALVPLLTGVLGIFALGEPLAFRDLCGMGLTLAGIALVILDRTPRAAGLVRINRPVSGILFALVSVLGQSLSYIAAKYGMGNYDNFAAAQIRLMAAGLGFAVLFTATRRWGMVAAAARNRPSMVSIAHGSFFGPFLGMSLSLLAIQKANVGVATTIMAITPVLIIPPEVILRRERIRRREVIGAMLAVAGVAVFFLH
ncbi:MAG: DMT family transporter [bacterium]|nr:DMT family transporter [bacterium]